MTAPSCVLLAGCLLFACVTDCASRLVYNFVWWIGAAAAGISLWGRLWQGLTGWVLADLGLFFLLQLLVFQHMYGKADCYAFCVCAIAEASLGMGLPGYLLHMLFSVIFLFPVQLFRRNIKSTGNLKTPVAFLPYITVSFLGELVFCKYCPILGEFAGNICAVFF